MKRTAIQAQRQRDILDRFARQFNAYVGDSRQYRQRVPVPMLFDPVDYKETLSYQTYDEAFVEIHMPREQFDYLVHISDSVERDAYRIDQAERIIKQNDIDKIIREGNPAVWNAWQKYQMLLELARK